MAAWIGLEKDQFEWDAGSPASFASSPGVVRRFCPTCGSPLSYEGERWPTEIHVYAASLDEPEAVAPRAHVNAGEQLPWFEVHDDLPRWAGIGSRDVPPLRKSPREG